MINYKAMRFDEEKLEVLDQRILPFEEKWITLRTCKEVETAIADMTVRGAGVIGCVGAIGAWFAVREAAGDKIKLKTLANSLKNARPTAVNLEYAVNRVLKAKDAYAEAVAINTEDAKASELIGAHGLREIQKILKKTGKKSINIMTHCNAGYLAIVDKGSALAPIYAAHEAGIDVHVWVDETRPRNQGANLTAWELGKSGVKHTLVADNMGALLMQRGMVDMMIVGADRVAANGDAANKIGTHLKALSAKAHKVPFFVALPSSTLDLSVKNGVRDIHIEERSADELLYMQGLADDGTVQSVRVAPTWTKGLNLGFDITPAKLITKLITEKGAFAPKKIKEYYGK
jgi:methylthioribose-1-phosphate isomerase